MMSPRFESVGEEITPVSEITGNTHRRIANLMGGAIEGMGNVLSGVGLVAGRSINAGIKAGIKVIRKTGQGLLGN